MPVCTQCGTPFVYGSILCSHCGADLDDLVSQDDTKTDPATTWLPVLGVPLVAQPHVWTLELHVIDVLGVAYEEGVYVARIPLSRLKQPVRLGRRDLDQCPPIRPELDLTDLLDAHRPLAEAPMISRLHAALQIEGGEVMLKNLVTHSEGRTWIRRSGSPEAHALGPNERRALAHRDVITVGQWSRMRVQLRVRLLI